MHLFQLLDCRLFISKALHSDSQLIDDSDNLFKQVALLMQLLFKHLL